MKILSLLLIFLVVVNAQPSTRVLLTDEARDNGALCLDGSPAAYYFHPGSGDGAKKWFLHYQGGGYCVSLADCYGRSTGGLGSSKSYPPNMDLGGGYFSNDPNSNPLMYNWNMVLFAYCDGGFYTGNNATTTNYNGHNLYFRGFRNTQAYYKNLVANHGLSTGTEFVIGGCSAGGIATFLLLDWWKENLPKSSVVKGLPDSGFVLEYENTDGGKDFIAAMNFIIKQMDSAGSLNKACLAAHPNDPVECLFAENSASYTTTPLFPLQSQYDSWQVQNILRSTTAGTINTYGQVMEARLRSTVLKNPQNGCFFDSCFHHCGEWGSIVIDNTRSGAALKTWYEGGKGTYLQNQPYPCNNCC